MEFVMSNFSGKQLSRFIKRNLEGTWANIADEAEKLFGSRGRIIAVLSKPRTMQGSKKGCEAILNDAGFHVERALMLGNCAYTLDGLRCAIARLRSLIEDDVCPELLKEGKCKREYCALKHDVSSWAT